MLHKYAETMYVLKLLTISIIFALQATVTSSTNLKVRYLKLCNDTQRLFKFKGNVTVENDNFYLDTNVMATLPLDENMGAICTLETKMNDHKYVELVTAREKDFCKACNAYLGEWWYEVQRSAQALPGKCPMLARRYELHHFKLNFQKVAVQVIPFGILRLTGRLVYLKNPNLNVLCLQAELENFPH